MKHQPIHPATATPIFTVAELQNAQSYFDRQAKLHEQPATRFWNGTKRAATFRNLSLLATIAEDSGSYDDQQELLAAMEAFGCDSIWQATECRA